MNNYESLWTIENGIVLPVVHHLKRLDFHYRFPRGYNAAIYFTMGYKNTAYVLCVRFKPPFEMMNTAKLIKISQKQIKRRKFLNLTQKFRDLLYFFAYVVSVSFCLIFRVVLYLILYPNYLYYNQLTIFHFYYLLYLNLQAVFAIV